jgi:hypothetical protein
MHIYRVVSGGSHQPSKLPWNECRGASRGLAGAGGRVHGSGMTAAAGCRVLPRVHRPPALARADGGTAHKHGRTLLVRCERPPGSSRVANVGWRGRAGGRRAAGGRVASRFVGYRTEVGSHRIYANPLARTWKRCNRLLSHGWAQEREPGWTNMRLGASLCADSKLRDVPACCLRACAGCACSESAADGSERYVGSAADGSERYVGNALGS